MTALTSLTSRATGEGWGRRLALSAAVVAVGLGGTGYLQARDTLAERRAELAGVQSELANVRDQLDQVAQDQSQAEADLTATREEIEFTVAARSWIDAVNANTATEVAAVGTSQSEVDVTRFLVGASSDQAQACLDGVSRAVGASRTGDDRGAASALRAAATACTQTLAVTSGARFPFDFADPFVLRADGVYYGYSTNSGAGDIQVIRSSDLVVWELVGNALADLPSWSAGNATWAPAVVPLGGRYVAFYTVREAASGRQCISRAVASTPAGPFHDDSTAPLVCQAGGSIDPSPFVAPDGQAYLLWKSEAVDGYPPGLWSQPLTADGIGLGDVPHLLLTVDRDFEHGVVEAPTMATEGGTTVLVYAAADWNSRNYSTAYATCAGPIGPCTKPADGRILQSGARLAGPGGAELFRSSDGALWVAFHAFTEPNVGYPSSRYLHIARFRLSGGRATIDGAT